MVSQPTALKVTITELPFELVLDIFEKCFYAHRRSALCLLRVSKTLLHSLVPIIYRTIIIKSVGQQKKVQIPLSYHHPRRELYVNAVKHLYMGPRIWPLPAEVFPNVESAMIKLYKPSFQLGLPMPYFSKLKQLTLHTFEDVQFLSNIPLQTVTHLYIASSRHLASMRDAIFPHDRLPNLTYIVSPILVSTANDRPVGAEGLCEYFDWLDGFQKLKVVGLVPASLDNRVKPRRNLVDLERIIGRNLHSTVVILHVKFRMENWRKWCLGGEDVWTLAEKEWACQREFLDGKNSLNRA